MKMVICSLAILGSCVASAASQTQVICVSSGFVGSQVTFDARNGNFSQAQLLQTDGLNVRAKNLFCFSDHESQGTESGLITTCVEEDDRWVGGSNVSVTLETGPMGEGLFAIVRDGRRVLNQLDKCSSTVDGN
jgi:hypothetical protein